MADIWELTAPHTRPDITHYKLAHLAWELPRVQVGAPQERQKPGSITVYVAPVYWSGTYWVEASQQHADDFNDDSVMQFVFDGSSTPSYDTAAAALAGLTWGQTEAWVMGQLASLGLIGAGSAVDYDTPP